MSKILHLGVITSFRNAGPQRFYRRLVNSLKTEENVKISSLLNPFHDISLQIINGKKYWGKPFFLRLDGVYLDAKNTIGDSKKLNKKILDSAKESSGVIFNSEFSKSIFFKIFNYKPKNYKVILTGTNKKTWNTVGGNYRNLFPDRELIIICSAKWREHKRLNEHINWFKTVNNKKWQLIVIGNTDLNTQDFENIHFTGWLDDEEISNWYRTADIYLHLAWIDFFPNSAIEAYSCGLPIVTNNIGGTKEIVENTNFGEIADIDEKIDVNYGLNLYQPPEIRKYNLITEAVHKAAIKSKNKYKFNLNFFSIDKCAKKYLNFIKGENNFEK